MKKNYIKYEKLSQNVRKEIEQYYSEQKIENKQLNIEEAMDIWFEQKFEKWLISNYFPEKGSEKRTHVRIDIDSEKKKKGKSSKVKKTGKGKYNIEIEVPVKIVDTLIESSLDDEEAITMVGSLVNISKGGFYFKFSKQLPVSSIIKVFIDLSKLDPEINFIEALAMVLRVDKLEEGGFGIGVMFSSIYDNQRENLDIFIFKNLAYYIYSQ